MHEPHRRLLLELYRAVAAAAPGDRAAAARACAAAWDVALQLELAAAARPAERIAVRLVHELELRAEPLCARLGPLADGGGESAALRAALAAAPLIAGREGRALLAIGLDAADAARHHGALVDAETCARIALAGGDLETGQGGALELLELAGDLVPALPGLADREPRAVLLAAVRLGTAEAARCLARGPVITMPG